MRLGEWLVQKKRLREEQLNAAVEEQLLTKELLGTILLKRNFIKEEDLLEVLSDQYGMRTVDLRKELIDWEVALRFSPKLVLDKVCMPLRKKETGIVVAITNPLDAEAIGLIEREAKGEKVEFVLAKLADLQWAIGHYNQRVFLKIQKILEQH